MKSDSTTKFIGLDVYSKTISVAIADEGRKGEVRHIGIMGMIHNFKLIATIASLIVNNMCSMFDFWEGVEKLR